MRKRLLLLVCCFSVVLGFSGSKNDDLLVHISFDNASRINEINSKSITVQGRIGKDTLDRFGVSNNALGLVTPEGGILIDTIFTTGGTWSINVWHKIIVADNDWLAKNQMLAMGREHVSGRPDYHTENAYGAYINLNDKYAIQDGITDGQYWGDPSSLKSFSVGPKVGVWSMTTLVVEGAKALIYIDGVKMDSLVITPFDLRAMSLLSAGYGDFDEYRVYDVAIDQSIIDELYAETSVVTALEDKQEAVGVYPNPTTGLLNFNDVAKAELLSTTGVVLQSKDVSVDNTMLVEQNAGAYFLRMITTSGDVQVKEIVVID